MEDMLYWVIEYIKVLFSYGFLMFVWPLVVFRNYLAGKNVTFRFSFCVTAQVVIINTVVLTLGLLHILNDWTVRLVFYGIFFYSIRQYFALTKDRKNKIKYLLHGSFGIKNFMRLERRKYLRILEEFCAKIWKFYKKRPVEYTMLVVVLIYGLIYFSWGAFQNYGYGTSDIIVHHSWTYQLSQGKIFSSGVYPEGMHCFVYALNSLFGVRIYSIMIFLQIIHLTSVFASMYCFLKEVFRWRFSAVFVILLFFILDIRCANGIVSMSRLQWVIPQEFGFHTIFLCAAFLVRYLKGSVLGLYKGKVTKMCWNSDLLIFTLALSGSILIHFYVTIMAFLVCVPIALFFLPRIFTKKRFLPLVCSVILGLVISTAPMLGALASGIPFQGSINWAVSLFEKPDTNIPVNGTVQPSVNNNNNDNVPESQPEFNQEDDGPGASLEVSGKVGQEEKVSFVSKVIYKVKEIVEKCLKIGRQSIQIIYDSGYVVLLGVERARWSIRVTMTMLCICVMHGICVFVKTKILKKKKEGAEFLLEYFALLCIPIVFMIMFTAVALGLPELIQAARLCAIATFFILVVFILPLDYVYAHTKKYIINGVQNAAAVCIMLVMVFVVYKTESYHGYLFCYLSRYNATVDVTNAIIDTMPKEQYTIVSTTEELYQVIGNGWHEELVDFLEGQEKESYTLPTEYVFIYLEKVAIEYVQNHFYSGPEWLALNEKYRFNPCSVGNEVLGKEISAEEAAKAMIRYGNRSSYYSEINSRLILESKLNEWCEKFKKEYPQELKTLYEDEQFICYYFVQNIQRPYNLNLEDK